MAAEQNKASQRVRKETAEETNQSAKVTQARSLPSLELSLDLLASGLLLGLEMGQKSGVRYWYDELDACDKLMQSSLNGAESYVRGP